MREDSRGERGAEAPTQEAILATFAVAEDAGEDPAAEPARDGPRRARIPSLRLERFLAALERLGCEVRQGKGSEVVVHRGGGKIARIGRHTRNREVPSALVQRVLGQVGVTLTEWVGVFRR